MPEIRTGMEERAASIVIAELQGRVMELEEALWCLYNEARSWWAFEAGMRELGGNTNYECLRLRLDAAKRVLDAAKGKV